jgi:hypothetical protein
MSSPLVSVLMVNWNTRDLLRVCLRSLRAQQLRGEMEVIVVDNNSGDGSEEMVRAEFPEVRLIQTSANTGYAEGNNIAFFYAEGDFLLTLNPDTELQPDTLQIAIDRLVAHPEWGAISVQFRYPDGRPQPSIREFPTLLNLVGEITGLAKRFPDSAIGNYRAHNFNYNLEGPAPQPMGTFLLFSRRYLAQCADPRRPFDEDFPIFFNEVDLLYRMQQAGFKCGYTPQTFILHHHGAGTGQVKPMMVWESHRSLVRYFEKHTQGPARALLPLVRLAIMIGAMLRTRQIHAGFRPQHHHLQLEHAE